MLFSAFIFTACETEESLTVIEPEPQFVLNTPGISSVFLNYSLPDNPAFTITWNDEIYGGSYTVEMATDADFSTPATLGTTDKNNFSMTVSELNNAIRNAGVTTFRDVPVYMRVLAGNAVSNNILLLVTSYPTDAPEITSPTASDAIVLSIDTVNDTALTVTWADAVLNSTLGLEITYTVEAAVANTDFTSPVLVGTIVNDDSITSTHADLNAAALGIGLTPAEVNNMEIRVIARNTNENGNTLERISESVIFSITPYSVSFPNLYFVGDATNPGWNPDNNNTPVFRDQDTPNAYVYTGYFNAGAFKLIEVIGQWQPQWGTNDGSTLAVNPGGGSDPGTFNVSAAGYYTYTFTTVGESGSFSVETYDASSATTYTAMGIIGNAIGGWGDADEVNFTQPDMNNPHIWNAQNVTFTEGEEFLIRANDAWSDVWRYTGSTELHGTALLAGSGDNFVFNAPTGSYNVWFNDLDGSYIIIPN